ncbi:hypothetical protein [Nocardia salmonicida]|uniref:hypothetical protein n=1 Tax=Nocardia salmonicida TaxID=53431 RepID=UPI0007A515CA|nr:hypothetical protein [Nocardia salmonicida]
MFLQQSMILLAAHPNPTFIAVAVLFVVGVLTVLVAVAALTAVLGGRERGERARLVLGDLLGAFRWGGRG